MGWLSVANVKCFKQQVAHQSVPNHVKWAVVFARHPKCCTICSLTLPCSNFGSQKASRERLYHNLIGCVLLLHLLFEPILRNLFVALFIYWSWMMMVLVSWPWCFTWNKRCSTSQTSPNPSPFFFWIVQYY